MTCTNPKYDFIFYSQYKSLYWISTLFVDLCYVELKTFQRTHTHFKVVKIDKKGNSRIIRVSHVIICGGIL